MGFRTDLVMEMSEFSGTPDKASETEDSLHYENGILIREIRIACEQDADRTGMPCGRYRTMEFTDEQLCCDQKSCAAVLTKQLRCFLPETGSLLVVGLGNESVIPDAIGPRVLRRLLVTRHLRKTLPSLFFGFRTVSAIQTGVMGNTGLESAEIVRSVVHGLRPDAVVAVDALASSNPERLCRVIQITDAGIVPGSGVGGDRAALNYGTLGIPVIAIGVPTVCELRSLVDTEVDMLVTPGKIDAQTENLSRVIAMGMNCAFHSGISSEDLAEFVGTM